MYFNSTKEANQWIGQIQEIAPTPILNLDIQSVDDYGTVENMLESVSTTLATIFFKYTWIGATSDEVTMMEEKRGAFMRHWFTPYKYNKTMKFINKNNITNQFDDRLQTFIKSMLSVNIRSDKGFG